MRSKTQYVRDAKESVSDYIEPKPGVQRLGKERGPEAEPSHPGQERGKFCPHRGLPNKLGAKTIRRVLPQDGQSASRDITLVGCRQHRSKILGTTWSAVSPVSNLSGYAT